METRNNGRTEEVEYSTDRDELAREIKRIVKEKKRKKTRNAFLTKNIGTTNITD